MLNRFTGIIFPKFLSTVFLCALLIILILPIINAPLHGDDLISPFSYYYEYEGSFRNYLANYSLSFDGHFNFFGEILSAFWLDFWISILIKTNSIYQFIMTYRILKILVMLLFLFLAIKLNRLVFPKLSIKLIGLYTSLSFLVVTVYHTNWSSDPVGNYPLTGYLSTSIGLIYIILLISRKLENRIYLNLAIIVVAVLYYEINIALIGVYLYYLKSKLGAKKIAFIIFTITSIAFCSYLLLLTSNAYSGGQLSLSWKFFSSLFLQLVSIFPPITFPLSIYFSNITIISSLTFFILLALVTRQLVRTYTKSEPEQRVQTMLKEIFDFNSIEKLLLVYFVGSSIIIALTQKYQNEIVYPGQVYMSYTSGQLFLIILLSRIMINYY
jgi:hypothetical protein